MFSRVSFDIFKETINCAIFGNIYKLNVNITFLRPINSIVEFNILAGIAVIIEYVQKKIGLLSSGFTYRNVWPAPFAD
jgi:hypothetical protein